MNGKVTSIEVSNRAILTLAIPAIASSLLNNLYRVIDQYSVQWLGTEPQAALAASTFILIASYALFMMISSGAGPLVARLVGSHDTRRLKHTILSALIMSGIAGIVFSVTLGIFTDEITGLVGLTGLAQEQLKLYLSSLAMTGTLMAATPLIDSVMIAAGDTRTPMKLQLISTILNALLNYLLIYRWNLGISGAAYASGISRSLVTIWGLKLLWDRYFVLPEQIDLPQVKHEGSVIIKIGIPIGIGVLLYALVYWAILKTTLAPLGSAATAALGIGFSALEGITWPVFAGLMSAVSSLTGRLLGRGDESGLDLMLRRALRPVLIAGVISAFVFVFGARLLCGLFTSDPHVLHEAVGYAYILGFSQLFVALEAYFEGVLSGAGFTRFHLWLSVPCNLARVPLSYFLAITLGWGSAGVWWAINITTYVKVIGKGLLVYLGKWKRLTL